MRKTVLSLTLMATLLFAGMASAQNAGQNEPRDPEDIRMEHLKNWEGQELTPTDRQLRKISAEQPKAPNFKLKDAQGKEVSLSDFEGHWVILDFWGTWCPWCIKGFPELRELYSKYKDAGLVIIGIDCNETKEQWLAGLEKYNLPWVNVYNPVKKGGVITDYYVSAYPTKIIIDPEGYIYHAVVGEDPLFGELIESLMYYDE